MRKLLLCLAFSLALAGLVSGVATAQGLNAEKNDELSRPKDYSNDSSVGSRPGPPRVPQITEDFEGGTPPAGLAMPWITNDYEGNGIVWDSQFGPYCGEADNWTGNASPGSGDFACVSSDIIGILDFDTDLWTESYDYCGASNSALLFAANYQNFANEDFFQVDWSTDGGGTWNNLLTWNEDHGGFRADPGEDVNLATAPAEGVPSVWYRFYYWDPAPDDWEWYIEIDDMVLDADGVIAVPGQGACGGPAASGNQLAFLALLLILGGAAFVMLRSRTA